MKKCLCLISVFLILATSCKWIKGSSEDDENGKDSIVVAIDSTRKDSIPADFFVNKKTYFYEDTVKIKGVITPVKENFMPDTAYLLTLDSPIDVLSHKEQQDMEDPNIPYSGIAQIHLLFPQENPKVTENKPMIIKGVLWGAYSGSHYTKVIMNVIFAKTEE